MTRRSMKNTVDRMLLFLKNNLDLVGILLVGILVRSWMFGDIPPGLNQDEAATGYDAWSVLHYGIDRNGFTLPVMFVSWGSGMYALNGYLAWPFMLMFGLSELSIRLPHLVLGIVSMMLLYLVTKKISDRSTAVIALFLIAINPWHIMISRWGLDSNILPGMFLIAFTLLIAGLSNRRTLPWAGAIFAICLYLYGTAYVTVPVFLLLALIFARRYWNVSWQSIGISAGTFVIVGLPIALYVLINHFDWDSIELPFMSIPNLSGPPRYQTASSVFSGDGSELMRNLSDFWRLILWQDDGLIWNSLPGFGHLYLIGLPFAFIGIFIAIEKVWKAKGKHLSAFFLCWLAASIVLATFQSANVNRLNIIYIPLIFFMAMGIQGVSAGSIFVRKSIICIFTIFFLFFAHTYFTWYPPEAQDDFFAGLGPAISKASQETDGLICVTGNVNMPYIFALFYTQGDPHVFNDTVQYDNPGAEFQSVSEYGRYRFGLHHCYPDTQAYVFHRDERAQFENSGYDVTDFDYYGTAIAPR